MGVAQGSLTLSCSVRAGNVAVELLQSGHEMSVQNVTTRLNMSGVADLCPSQTSRVASSCPGAKCQTQAHTPSSACQTSIRPSPPSQTQASICSTLPAAWQCPWTSLRFIMARSNPLMPFLAAEACSPNTAYGLNP